MIIISTGVYWYLLSLLVLGMDFISKYWVIKHFKIEESVSAIPLVNFTYIRNYGAIFGFFSDWGERQCWAFTLIAVLITMVLLFFMYRSEKRKKLYNAAYAMIIGGAIGNILDRIEYGFVIDFIDFYIGQWHWPIFNIADAGICIGAGLILIECIFRKKEQ